MGVCRGEGGLRLYKELCTEIKHCTLKNKTGRGAAELQEGGGGVQDELSPPSQCLRCAGGGGVCGICLCTENSPSALMLGQQGGGWGAVGAQSWGLGPPHHHHHHLPPATPSQNPVGSAWQHCRAVI